ncbi:homoserine dehydrogenase [Helicobacter cynogastricus]|uniref:homoserine dehydrogenase n=1 Tax=Helicobacter cynogastricus TaxID=329937 RepID=UPI000CF036AA|nr:homoserine dehydrogenase [Helicobacter cynogastricus]
MRTLNIGIIGLGSVGMSVVDILQKSQESISRRCGVRLQVCKGVVRDLSKPRKVNFALSNQATDILDDPKIDIVVELIGGMQEAFEIAQQALKKQKLFVTANKAMLAVHYLTLQNLATKAIGFEASVGGGLPIVNVLKDGLASSGILRLSGILNGTSNFILSQMEQGQSFEKALKEAQELGYAEADPTLDISGEDSAHKLVILSTLAFQTRPKVDFISGIENLSNIDLEHAQSLGYRIKLLAHAQWQDHNLSLRVCPTCIPQAHFLAQVNGVMNGVAIKGDYVGETFYYGPGAGGLASASAVVSDLIALAKNPTPPPPIHPISYTPVDFPTSYYLRLQNSNSLFCLQELGILSYHCDKDRVICITKPTTQEKIQALFSARQLDCALPIYES